MQHSRKLSLLLALTIGACARYEYASDIDSRGGCRLPPHQLADVTLPSGEGDTSVIAGRIVGIRTRAIVQFARVVIGRDTVIADAAGRFRMRQLPPGRYGLDVQRVGYLRARDSIALPLQRGHLLEVQLEPDYLDGACGGFATLVTSKPWWKFW